MFRKGLVFGMAVMFIGTGVVTCVSENTNEISQPFCKIGDSWTYQSTIDDNIDTKFDLNDVSFSNLRFVVTSPLFDWNKHIIIRKNLGLTYDRNMQPDYNLIIESLNGIIHPLNNSPLNLNDVDFEVLSYLDDAKIVGLGEATHGTKEFFELKHRIFKYLVEHHGFNVFAFECDMGESYYINNFVTKGEGDIDNIMKNIMHFWTWRTEEVKELLLWMKEYNQDKSDGDKIHFIGVDCQFMTYQADIILNYFNETNIPLSDPSIQFLHEIDQISSNTYYFYQNVTLNKKLEIDQNVDLLIEEIEDSKDELVAAFTEFEYYFLIQLALNIKQVNDVMYGMAQGDQKNYRDLYMAENTLWTADVFGVDTKVALWAHNMHVSNLDSFGSMGSYLKEELHYEYQIIGFSFSDGSFTAVRMVGLNPVSLGTIRIWREPKYGSINYIFHHAQYDNFILQASDIQENSSFDIYISQSQYFLQIGAGFSRFLHLIGIYYVFTDLMEEYDVVIHWDTTETAEQLR